MGIVGKPLEQPQDMGHWIQQLYELLRDERVSELIDRLFVLVDKIETNTDTVEGAMTPMLAKLDQLIALNTGIKPKMDQMINLLTQIEQNTQPAP